jgi:glycosyltransferase involved in cell wall biosynthesis
MNRSLEKILVIGPDSIHTENFYALLSPGFRHAYLATDKPGSDAPDRFSLTFSLKQPFRFLKSIFQLRDIIRTTRPDIIHVQGANTPSFLAGLAVGKSSPLFITAWGSDILLAGKMGWLYTRMVRFALRRAKGVTADASFMNDVMDNIAGKELKFLNANFGIDLPMTGSVEKQKMVFSNRSHNPLYRIDKILVVFAEFKRTEKGRDWKLVVAGSGSTTEDLKKLSVQLGIENNVQFVGWIDGSKNVAYYKAAAIYISFPESDATSISLLEAMAYGCVPVVSDLPANREWIQDGKNGVVTHQLSVSDIQRALDLDAREVLISNMSLLREKGTKEANRNKYLRFYEEVLNAAN